MTGPDVDFSQKTDRDGSCEGGIPVPWRAKAGRKAAREAAKPTLGKPSDAIATYPCKVSMLNIRGKIELELGDGRVIHGHYPHDLFGKIRSIRLGEQLKFFLPRAIIFGHWSEQILYYRY